MPRPKNPDRVTFRRYPLRIRPDLYGPFEEAAAAAHRSVNEHINFLMDREVQRFQRAQKRPRRPRAE